MTALLIAAGLVGLFVGGHVLVTGASALAYRLGVPAFVVGLTVVGFGTSLPELMVSALAAIEGRPGIAIGNVIGSNIANILLILGLAATIAPLPALADTRRDMVWMLAAAFLCIPVFWNGTVGLVEGAVLLSALAVFLWDAFRRPRPPQIDDAMPALGLGLALLATAGGLVAILLGARALIDGATDLARTLGLSEAVIGLTVVAVGTSLPELATSVIAAVKGQREIALGNVIGSNIFNILAILGITALVAPIPVEGRFLVADVPLMIVISLGLAALALGLGRIGRLAGVAALALYAGYTVASATL